MSRKRDHVKRKVQWILLVLFLFQDKKNLCVCVVCALMLSSFKNLLLSIFMFFKIVWMRKLFGAVFSFLFFLALSLLSLFLDRKELRKENRLSVSFLRRWAQIVCLDAQSFPFFLHVQMYDLLQFSGVVWYKACKEKLRSFLLQSA